MCCNIFFSKIVTNIFYWFREKKMQKIVFFCLKMAKNPKISSGFFCFLFFRVAHMFLEWKHIEKMGISIFFRRVSRDGWSLLSIDWMNFWCKFSFLNSMLYPQWKKFFCCLYIAWPVAPSQPILYNIQHRPQHQDSVICVLQKVSKWNWSFSFSIGNFSRSTVLLFASNMVVSCKNISIVVFGCESC